MEWSHKFIAESGPPCLVRRTVPAGVAATPTDLDLPSRGQVVHALRRAAGAARRCMTWFRARVTAALAVVAHAVVITEAVREALLDVPIISSSTVATGAILSACAVTHACCTRSRAQRRTGDRNEQPVDQSAIWLITAAAALPLVWALGLLLILRLVRWREHGAHPRGFLFATSTTVASVLAAHVVATTTPLHDWLTHGSAWPETTLGRFHLVALLIALGAAYFAVQALSRCSATPRTTDSLIAAQGMTVVTVLIGLATTTATAVSPLIMPTFIPIAIHMTRLVQTNRVLGNDAIHDPLMGLLNRRGFLPLAQKVLQRDIAANRPMTVLFADLDNFKSWNDDLGELGGDEILKAVAATLERESRVEDLLCRWGGEEFVAVLPRTDLEQGTEVAERIRLAVERLDTLVRLPGSTEHLRIGRDTRPCTISIGVATSPAHGVRLDELVDTAIRAKKSAKAGGRNRVVRARDGA
ncbi:GGDEF domain-containing protein [Amycolatopsis tucumanensis]|uniref:GGDEF domain-containing protein n=2 Tax=Amycolatopsis tucumanensis TaxID=401106 RepID=A0ABP7HEI4_9PSEU